MQSESLKSLKGRYVFKQNGVVIAESKNIITTRGQKEILKYLARQQEGYADNIVLGIGTSTPAANDEYLDFTTFAVPVEGYFYDDTNNEIVYQAIVPSGVISKIYEAGLATNYPIFLTSNTDTISTSSDLLCSFDTTEDWFLYSGVEFHTDNSLSILRSGQTGLRFTLTNDVKNSPLSFPNIFQTYDETDVLKIALNIDNNLPTQIDIKFYDNANGGNSYEWILPNLSLGYNIKEVTIGSLTPPGSPLSLSDVDTIEVSVTSTASTVITFDALRIDHVSDRFGYALISRSVLDSPSTLSLEAPIDIEYRLEFDF
jgi:hypothetical protein